jgi:hypothetical protein
MPGCDRLGVCRMNTRELCERTNASHRARPTISSQSRHSARTVRIHRSAYAFALGVRTGVNSTGPTLPAEHVVEAAGELRVPITQQEPHPSSLLAEHQQVAGLLGDPGTVGVGGYARQVDPWSLVLVACHDSSRLLAAGTPAMRWPLVGVPGPAHGGAASRIPGRRHLHAKSQQLTLDPLVPQVGFSPARRMISCWTSWSSGGRPVWRWGRSTRLPPAADAPAQQRLRPDEEARPAGPRQYPADRGQQRPVGGLELGTWALAASHGEWHTARYARLDSTRELPRGRQRPQRTELPSGTNQQVTGHVDFAHPSRDLPPAATAGRSTAAGRSPTSGWRRTRWPS